MRTITLLRVAVQKRSVQMKNEDKVSRLERRLEWLDEGMGLSGGFYQRQLLKKRGLEARQEPGRKVYHSGFYHRLFEGYREVRVPRDGRERGRITRVYTGDYYKRACGELRWHLTKAAYLLLYLVATAVYLFAMTRRVEVNTVWYTAAPGLLSVIPMILLFSKLTACLSANRNMVIYDYKYVFQRLFPLCALTAFFLCTTALMCLAFLLLHPQSDIKNELVPCLGCLLGAGLILTIGLIERNAKYEIVRNQAAPPPK